MPPWETGPIKPKSSAAGRAIMKWLKENAPSFDLAETLAIKRNPDNRAPYKDAVTGSMWDRGPITPSSRVLPEGGGGIARAAGRTAPPTAAPAAEAEEAPVPHARIPRSHPWHPDNRAAGRTAPPTAAPAAEAEEAPVPVKSVKTVSFQRPPQQEEEAKLGGAGYEARLNNPSAYDYDEDNIRRFPFLLRDGSDFPAQQPTTKSLDLPVPPTPEGWGPLHETTDPEGGWPAAAVAPDVAVIDAGGGAVEGDGGGDAVAGPAVAPVSSAKITVNAPAVAASDAPPPADGKYSAYAKSGYDPGRVGDTLAPGESKYFDDFWKKRDADPRFPLTDKQGTAADLGRGFGRDVSEGWEKLAIAKNLRNMWKKK